MASYGRTGVGQPDTSGTTGALLPSFRTKFRVAEGVYGGLYRVEGRRQVFCCTSAERSPAAGAQHRWPTEYWTELSTQQSRWSGWTGTQTEVAEEGPTSGDT